MPNRDPYETCNAYLEANGSSVKASLIGATTAFFSGDFDNHPEYDEVTYWGDSSYKKQGLIITQSNTLKNASNDRIAIARPGEELVSGSIINWKNTQWLVYEVNNYNILSDVANIKHCKYLLKFFDSKYRYAETPCALVKTLLKEDNSHYQDVGSDEIWLLVPSNEYTDCIPKGGRIMIGRNVYTLESIDFVEYDNVVKIRLAQNDINHTEDNVELGIASYVSNINHYSLTFNSPEKKSVLIGSRHNLCASVLLDRNPTSYGVSYSSSNEEVVTVSTCGITEARSVGTAVVRIEFLGLVEELILSVTDVIEERLTVEVAAGSAGKLWAEYEDVISVNVYENGVLSNDKKLVWSIVDGLGYAEIKPYGNRCKVSTGKITNTQITIRAALASDQSVYVDHTIKIVGLLG